MGQGIYSQVLSGRLGRTALFIAATTYGDTGMVAQVVTRVRAVHARARNGAGRSRLSRGRSGA
ncbi:oxygenase MpaB family protein [Metallibacterium sp.]